MNENTELPSIDETSKKIEALLIPLSPELQAPIRVIMEFMFQMVTAIIESKKQDGDKKFYVEQQETNYRLENLENEIVGIREEMRQNREEMRQTREETVELLKIIAKSLAK